MEPLISSRLTEAGWGWVGVLKKRRGGGKGALHTHTTNMCQHTYSRVFTGIISVCVCLNAGVFAC